jgi:uncharacterized integral membrane protein
MNKLTRFLVAIFVFLVFTFSVIFFRLNTTSIELKFGPWVTPPQAVSVWIAISFLCGSMLGVLLSVGLFQRLKLKYALRKARIEIESLRLDLQRLKVEER